MASPINNGNTICAQYDSEGEQIWNPRHDFAGGDVVTTQTNPVTGRSELSVADELVPVGKAATPARRNRVIKQFSDLLGVTVGTTNATVTKSIDVNSPFGCPALKLVCTFTANGGRVEVTPPQTNIPNFNGHVAYTLWVDDATKVSALAVFLGTAGYAKYRTSNQAVFSGGDLVAGHRVVYDGPLRKNNVTDGGFVFGSDPLQETKLRIVGALGDTTTLWVRDCFIPAPQKPLVCYTWDDGHTSWTTKVAPALANNGIKATFAINTNNLNKVNGISTAEVGDLLEAGHHVAGHNVYNYKLQTLYGIGLGENNGSGQSQSLQGYVGDYHSGRLGLEAIGVAPESFMYHPYVQGGADHGAAEALQNAGVDLIRTTWPYEAQLYGFELGNNALALRSVNLDSSRTLEQAKAMIDDARVFGGLCVFMGHETDDATAGPVTWRTSDLEALLAYSAGLPDVEHLTMQQLRDRFVQLGVLTHRFSSSFLPVRCIGRLLNANMNSIADQAITLDPGQWKIEGVYFTKPSISLTTAAGGVYTAAAKGGTAIVAANQAYAGLAATTDVVSGIMAATPTVNSGSIYLSLTTAQGAAATADIFVFGRPI